MDTHFGPIKPFILYSPSANALNIKSSEFRSCEFMKQIHHTSVWILGGILIILSFIMNPMIRIAESSNGVQPRTATQGSWIFTIGVTGVAGSDNAHFMWPVAIAINATGDIYVADYTADRVLVFSNSCTYKYTVNVDHPNGVAVNATGYLFVALYSHHCVQVFDKAGIYQYTIGVNGVAGTDNGHFNETVAVTVNTTGHIFVADYQNQRVQVFDKAGIYQFTIGETGVIGSDNNHFAWLQGVAVASTGHIYIADGNNRVQVFDKAGIYQYTIKEHIGWPEAVAVNTTGALFVADYNDRQVKVFETDGTYQYAIGVLGVEGSDNTHFDGPSGVSVNATGHVFVADKNNFRVQVFAIDYSPQTQPEGIPGLPVTMLVIASGFVIFYLIHRVKLYLHA